ncbi:MAG: gamma-glutamylcyclotransferase [Myxococcales bacterium]|nr:gamma-glutamylcyclotransferase [Myxococcales bacterium]
MDEQSVWLFGYGSVIYRPSFEFVESRPATLRGFARRFSQRSDDHRGTPSLPGRVVTLVAREGASVRGIAYRFDAAQAEATFVALDHRERAGYERSAVEIELDHGALASAYVYIAPRGNAWDAGDERDEDIAATILRAHGPSGSNVEYLLRLADALRSLGDRDPHVFALEAAVLAAR